MAALHWIRLSTLILIPAGMLALAAPAFAGDVTVQLDAGTGFSLGDSTGTIERLRVDEVTGNISRNGALFVHTTGGNSLFVGVAAGNLSTSGNDNAAFGRGALASNTTGSSNTAIGAVALFSNTTGRVNSAVGNGALYSNTTGYLNSAVGQRALFANTTGISNTAVGTNALASNTSGRDNSALGVTALGDNTTGRYNSAVGLNALRFNTSASSNSAFGENALTNNSFASANSNSAFGARALFSNTSGSGNTGIGSSALFFNSTGARNVALGQGAGLNQTTGSDNIYLVNRGVAGESGRIKIGIAGTHTASFIAGIRGVTTGVADAIPVLIDSAGQLGTVSSSRKVKQEIRDMGDATARLLELRPVTFRYKQQQTLPSDAEAPPVYGLIAEEVAEVFPDLVVHDENGQPFTVKYHEMAPMLLNEMKKQQHTIETQRQENQAQQQQIATLTTRLRQLETRVIGRSGEAP